MDKLIYGTRKVLGGPEALSYTEGNPGEPVRYRLGDDVVTDIELFEHALDCAHAVADASEGWQQALDVLRPQLARIETRAFDTDHMGRGLSDWAIARRLTECVEEPLVTAALLLADLASDDTSRIPKALWAIDQVLIACPTNESLIRAAGRLDAQLGNREAANRRYQAISKQLAIDELEPEAETTQLRHDIMATQDKIGWNRQFSSNSTWAASDH